MSQTPVAVRVTLAATWTTETWSMQRVAALALRDPQRPTQFAAATTGTALFVYQRVDGAEGRTTYMTAMGRLCEHAEIQAHALVVAHHPSHAIGYSRLQPHERAVLFPQADSSSSSSNVLWMNYPAYSLLNDLPTLLTDAGDVCTLVDDLMTTYRALSSPPEAAASKARVCAPSLANVFAYRDGDAKGRIHFLLTDFGDDRVADGGSSWLATFLAALAAYVGEWQRQGSAVPPLVRAADILAMIEEAMAEADV